MPPAEKRRLCEEVMGLLEQGVITPYAGESLAEVKQ